MNKKLLWLMIVLSSVYINATGLPNSYYEIKDIKKQKRVFFNTLTPLIENERKNILKDREFVINYFNFKLLSLRYDGINTLKLIKIKKYYKIKNIYSYDEYLEKVDVIPTSIILAQAVLESGWGKSRFVRKANNIFGHWSYSGHGLIPLRRDAKAKHRIKIFKSLQDAIKAYLRNINTHNAYKSLRLKRAKVRFTKKYIDGLDLYEEYINYSQIRQEYIKRLKKIIVQNNLLKYDRY
jgi:Bax protein